MLAHSKTDGRGDLPPGWEDPKETALRRTRKQYRGYPGWLKVWLLAALTIAVAALGVALWTSKAEAAGGAKAKGTIAAPASSPTALEPGRPDFLPVGDMASPASWAGPWTGLGIGAYGAWINADTDTSPVGLGSTGCAAGAELTGSLQLGQVVVEGFGEYGWVGCDLHKLGVDRQMALGGRLGVLANPHTYIYGLGAVAWVDTSAGMFNGRHYGGGVQYRFGGSPWFGRLEYRHEEYDTRGKLGVDTVADTVRVGLDLKFQTK